MKYWKTSAALVAALVLVAIAASAAMQGAVSEQVKFIKIKDHSAAGTSAITSIAVDTQGFQGACFLNSFGTAAADNTWKVQQSSDDGVADAYSDLEGTSVVSGASPSNEDLVLDIPKPRKRYLKLIATPTTSSTVESMWVCLYNTSTVPVTQGVSGTLVHEIDPSPAEGTP